MHRGKAEDEEEKKDMKRERDEKNGTGEKETRKMM